MKTTTVAAEAKPYHHGDLRRALLESADAILERDGPNALSLRAVAREAGVSPAAPYHHFKDKDELLSAIAQEGFDRLKAALTAACVAEHDPRRKMSDLGVAYVKFAQSHPALYQVMYDRARAEDGLPQKDVHEKDHDAFHIVKDALTEVGGNYFSETDIHLAAIASWCAAHGLAEMSSFVQFRPLKAELGGEEAFLRAVLEHLGMFRGAPNPY
ncbi:MAG TPA: TetR/AcrR family transcriptional regulator [Caulobacteraceae bacterium]|jgi:AcrR family transcriptional regulator|nr:TetR/AcrR family transcriptional regulator [Caulobacteraceae bacterium]